MPDYCYKTAILSKNFYIRFKMRLKKGLLKRETHINQQNVHKWYHAGESWYSINPSWNVLNLWNVEHF